MEQYKLILQNESSYTPVELPPLPYSTDALTPFISEQTLMIHHDHHHRRYIVQLSALIKGSPFQNSSLEQIIKAARGAKEKYESQYMLASQAWNHGFYWKSMIPHGGQEPHGQLDQMIKDSFGGYEGFRKLFIKLAMQIGVGWVWLMHDKGNLKLTRTEYHESPLFTGAGTPLLTIDVWEHAYYIDVQSRKQKYVEQYLDRLANWSFAEAQMNQQ
jgi:Fe-Mn family superoxide dismutase